MLYIVKLYQQASFDQESQVYWDSQLKCLREYFELSFSRYGIKRSWDSKEILGTLWRWPRKKKVFWEGKGKMEKIQRLERRRVSMSPAIKRRGQKERNGDRQKDEPEPETGPVLCFRQRHHRPCSCWNSWKSAWTSALQVRSLEV